MFRVRESGIREDPCRLLGVDRWCASFLPLLLCAYRSQSVTATPPLQRCLPMQCIRHRHSQPGQDVRLRKVVARRYIVRKPEGKNGAGVRSGATCSAPASLRTRVCDCTATVPRQCERAVATVYARAALSQYCSLIRAFRKCCRSSDADIRSNASGCAALPTSDHR